MILIDAVYISTSGGYALLSMLLEEVVKVNSRFLFLIDKRLEIKRENIKNVKFVYLNNSEIGRLKFYLKNNKNFAKVLCFANVPPPIALDCPVYTYFHNVLLFDKKTQKSFSKKNHIILNIKGAYIKFRKKNTNKWFVQTDLVKKLLVRSLNINPSDINIYPFYYEQKPKNIKSLKKDDFFYPATGAKHKNHLLLLKVWENIFEEHDLRPALHLTVDEEVYTVINKKIKFLQNKGLQITNHGYITKEQTQKLYETCKFVIHPSAGESFGLVLIEAIENGNILLAPDLPYVNAVVKPNYFFDLNIESIKMAVLLALSASEVLPSQIKVKNEISKLLNKLLK